MDSWLLNKGLVKPKQVAMRALGFEVKKVDVLKILKDYDREGNGKITFEDFSEVGKFLCPLSPKLIN